MRKPVKVLFVCMGNICRSPTAHGVFRDLVDEHDLGDAIAVDSAGTHGYHLAAPPDPRSQATASDRGVDLSALRARRFVADDFIEFDYLLAMDRNNLDNMLAIKPAGSRGHACLLLEYADQFEQAEIPDPYYGDDGFDLVFDMVENASHGLLHQICHDHDL